jgi:hypothetical protein
VRVILMTGSESEAVRFSHAWARMNAALQAPLAQIRRIEQHQRTLVNWLNPPDQTPLEATIGIEQVAIEETASVAQAEPDPYLAQTYRFASAAKSPAPSNSYKEKERHGKSQEAPRQGRYCAPQRGSSEGPRVAQ